MSEQHRQQDMINPQASSEGRERIKQGISRFRTKYDANFSLENVCCDPEKQLCFVEWTSALDRRSGENEQDGQETVTIVGVSVLSFEDSMIAETRVYRQATES